MLKKLRQQSKGFTIVEVLIVLAIAGLILLIVFLAVPALQRNNRNTQRSNDAAIVLGGIQESINANNGQLPTAVALASGVVTFTGAGGNNVTVNIGSQFTSVTIAAQSGAAASQNTLQIQTGATCNATNTATAAGAARSYVAFWQNEPTANTCRAS